MIGMYNRVLTLKVKESGGRGADLTIHVREMYRGQIAGHYVTMLAEQLTRPFEVLLYIIHRCPFQDELIRDEPLKKFRDSPC